MNHYRPQALSMDVPARDGTLLHLTVALTGSGHVELDNLLEVEEHYPHGFRPLAAYTVHGFLAAADDRGQLTLHMGNPELTIERNWMMTIGDWLQMLSEDVTEAG